MNMKVGLALKAIGLGECWNFEMVVVPNVTILYRESITINNEFQERDILYTCLRVSFHVGCSLSKF